ncbi:hypothetical protein C2E20_1430 [Micractinium conductrix]|uniref:Uncharacterized protein n=1 Tax=Micractinium conductrix TaxID=554055 RepID=A0A2P6VMH4_9CHLO|nr:hypothetical protein C2E20_1430 [Micractinium conductrix]|eukprot:PSC75283.1 hypothetical protein C2E20_1430 [Micractinium conductrix]
MGRKKCRTKAPVKLVQCPACDMTMRMTTVGMHLTTCMKRKEQQQRRQPGGHGGGATAEQQLAGPHPPPVQQADEVGASSELVSLYFEDSAPAPPRPLRGAPGGDGPPHKRPRTEAQAASSARQAATPHQVAIDEAIRGGAASAFIAAERLGRALRPGAPVVVAGSGSFQAGIATAVAAALEGQGFAVEACHPDLDGLEHCRPDHAFTVILLRKPGLPHAPRSLAQPLADVRSKWQQQQQLHPPPQPSTSPGATSNSGVVYAIQPPGVLRAEIEPATVHGPADLRAVVQQAVQLSPGYLGSTTRDVAVRLREHANALLAGTHSCLQAQEQPVFDQLWREHPGSSAADSEARTAAYRANLEQRCVVVARVSAASFGGDRSQMEVLLGAAEQAGIDACTATILNRSLTVGPRFVSMPGMCQATGALRMALDGYDEDGKSIAAQNMGNTPMEVTFEDGSTRIMTANALGGVAAAATYAERQRASGIEGVRFQWVHRGVVLHTTDMSPKGINVHIPKGLRHLVSSRAGA